MKQLDEKYVGGTLSEATMRNEDLIPSFMHFLQVVKGECQIEEEVDKLQKEVNKLITVGDYYMDDYTEESQEEASWILNEDIFYLLNDIAPEFCYFGSHEGDGALFGFWTSDEALSEWIQLQMDGFVLDDPFLDFDDVRSMCIRVLETLDRHDR